MRKLPFVLIPLISFLGVAWLDSAGEDPVAVAVVSDDDPVRAETLYAEGSYALAHSIYAALRDSDLPGPERRWAEFRWADTLWRSQAATATADDSKLDEARRSLEALVQAVARPEDRDLVWAESQESLGDFWWSRRRSRNWGQAWPHYQAALDFWAGSREIAPARERYLAMVRKADRPPEVDPYYVYGGYGNRLPIEILDNALEIAVRPDDRAHLHYLIAMTLATSGGEPASRRAREEFEAAIEAGVGTDWLDDALYHYAEWLARAGRETRTEDGQRRREPDYPAAVAVYRRVVREYPKGETRYHDDASRRIEQITAPSLGLAVSSFFLPDSEIEFHLSWRNVSEVKLALYRIDLVTDIGFSGDENSRAWLERVTLPGRPAIRTWPRPTHDAGDHVPGQETVTLDPKLPRGAYVLEARAGGERVRELILVTGASLVMKTSSTQALVYLCDALSGAPRKNAEISLWVRSYNNRVWGWERLRGKSDAEGLAHFRLPETSSGRDLFVAAAEGDDQALGFGSGGSRRADGDRWRIYAFTDRPAYRPGDEAHWKIVARRHDGETYSTPSGRTVEYRITDPRGSEVAKGDLRLNAFGSAWSSIRLGDALPLGEYRVHLTDSDGNRGIGGATLFRLEEYKLPEFKVDVRTPTEDDRPKAFRVGDRVEAEVTAEYYFGGPVDGAEVEVLVYQRPLWVGWNPPREFPWFYEDMQQRQRWWGGPGQIVHRETLRTGADGTATVAFETPPHAQQDFEYTVEARVTDASRREITGRGSVRVSRQRYFVFPRVEHSLYRPGDEVRIEIKTLDANEQPFRAEGRVTITRDRWVEVWVDPRGREVAGESLDKLRARTGLFPPPDDSGWRLKSQGYESEVVLRELIRTGDEGEAEVVFTPSREGFYRFEWSGDEDEPFPVRAETTVWVADPDTVDVGYHHGGVGIILDRDTFEAGRKVPVMLTTPARDSYVLFTLEGEDLHEYRLVHVTGTVKLIELEIDEGFTPNVFLDAVLVHDGQLFMDSKQVVVPPVEHFLEVAVETDRESYEPRQQGMLTVTTRDRDGNPVSAEVALGLIDESVLYIQQEYAGDPRQFFYGTKRGKLVRTASTFHVKRYVRLGDDRDDASDVTPVEDERRQKEELTEVSSLQRAVGGAAMDAVLGEAEGFVVAKKSMAQAPSVAPSEFDVAEGPAVQVRSDFRSTALWAPDVVTGEDGTATVPVKFPDSLTTWKATARVATTDNRFGTATTTSKTSKALLVRLQAPRFFVIGDRVTVSAVINNNTDAPIDVIPTLNPDGLDIAYGGEASVRVPAMGEARVDWTVEAREAGTARLEVVARGGDHADAMARDYRVWEHGVEKLVALSGKTRGDRASVVIDLPRERRPGSTSMIVQVTPSLAVTMLDALPYLIDYPYGCTEQTMSRFLPAAITARTLDGLGLKPAEIAGRLFGGLESETSAQTHPDGPKDLARLDDMVRKGLARLYDFQHGDGGWGWWKEGDSDHYMTAYVVWGLGIARDAGIKVDSNVLQRGASYLNVELVEQESRPDLQAWMLHALTSAGAARRGSPTDFERKAYDNLWAQRSSLNAYSISLLALSAHHLGDTERTSVLVRNLENGVVRDEAPDTSDLLPGRTHQEAVTATAHWGADGLYWRWSEGPVEATSFALRALLAIDPDHALIEPVTNWLIKNRRGAQWSNTRDTAMAVLTLSDYLVASGELDSEVEYEVLVNGRSVTRQRVPAADVLAAPGRFEVDPTRVRDGENSVEIVRLGGDGPLYFATETRYFSLEEPVTPEGNEIFVRRQYYRLAAHPTLLKGHVYEREPLADLGAVVSGERVEVVVTVEAKNDYEYLVFEDLKPAGLEAVRVRSGEAVYARELRSDALDTTPERRGSGDFTGRTRWVYQELRDRKVVLFIDKLPEGRWEIRYDLRAEVPGSFHALPVLGHAMYVPEIRCNSAEVRLRIEDR